ncbi:hypothetical protein AV654_12395 [Paenibacillus elgii]|uniref:Putative tail fiber protein gp53-like C-terminal domain-containing protein n=1 Tax=Paenibacillus elgii TaxID=189691 RepID=A0A163YTS9_9BACL|nr:hypothetical protein [Paenibacillus elgii]KZE80307.1 hypothetical protein AV654_12395 [Paenibacillus elgii]
MSGNKTSNLNMHHWTGADPVLRTEFNENFEKIDAFAGQLLAEEPAPVQLGYGMQVVNAKQTSMLENVSIKGRTLVNLLGREGNFENSGKWTEGNGDLIIDATVRKFGNASGKIDNSTGTGEKVRYNSQPLYLAGKYVLYGVWARSAAGAPQGELFLIVRNADGTVKWTNTVDNGHCSFYINATPEWRFYYQALDLTGSSAPYYTARIDVNTFGTTNDVIYYDGLVVYEISRDEFTAFRENKLNYDQVVAKYPYVDDVKHVNSPYVIKYGENLLPPFHEWILNPNATAIEPYKLRLVTNTVDSYSTARVAVLPGRHYTLSGDPGSGNYEVYACDSEYNFIKDFGQFLASNSSITFKTPSTASYLDIRATNRNTASIATTFNQPMLYLGTAAKPFQPRNDDYLFFPNVQLASSVDGTACDTLFQRDGKYWKQARFKTMDLDGSLPWKFHNDNTGFKQVRIENLYTNARNKTVIKHDGKILTVTPAAISLADSVYHNPSDPITLNNLYISIADTDSGWGELYEPSPTEIQAYFNGWKMFEWGKPNNTAYTRTDNTLKAWVQIGETDYGSPKNTTRITPSTTIATAFKYRPYRLTYELAAPVAEEILFEGGISFREGLNQVEVGSGMIVREKAPLTINTGIAVAMGDITFPSEHSIRKVTAAYKNGQHDPGWYESTINPFGLVKARLDWMNYDPTAAYTVTYLALDQYALTCNLESIQGEYASNLKKVVDALAAHQADVEARVSATENLARQVHISQKGVINPWGDNNSAISKAANGYQKLPSGLILQWGTAEITNSGAVTFPVAFPNYVMHVYGQVETSVASQTVGIGSYSNTQFMAWTVTGPKQTIHWFAIGY